MYQLILVLVVVVSSCVSACSGELKAGRITHSSSDVPGPWSTDIEYLLRQAAEESWVKLYRKLENTLLSSPELLDKLREKFFPSQSRYRAKDPASIDGIQVDLIPICVIFRTDDSNRNTSLNCLTSKCMNFRWTNSRLLNIIPADQLSALDPFWTKMLYSAIVSSRMYGQPTVIILELDMDDIDYRTLTEEDIVTSMAILLSWSKNLALDRTGEHLSQENQGYVVPWYHYYSIDNRYQEDSLTIKHIIIYLNCFFVAMNAFVVVLLARYSTKILSTIGQLCATPNFTSSIHKGALCTATLLVIIYLTAVLIHDCQSGDFQLYTTDPIFRDKIKGCIASLCIRVGVLIIAGIVHAGVVVYSTVIAHHQYGKIFKYQLLDAIVLWGTFMFCQLWIGVFSIPIVTFLAISPTIVLFHLCMAVLICIHLIAPMAYLIHYFNSRSRAGLKCVRVALFYIAYYLVTSAVTVSASVIYYEIMIRGAVPHGAQGFFLSFIPPVILSLTLWLIKTKLFTNKKVSHTSMRQKIIYMV